MCRENGFCFVDNSNISVDNIFKDKLYLFDSGKTILVDNFIYCINNYFLLTHTHHPHFWLKMPLLNQSVRNASVYKWYRK